MLCCYAHTSEPLEMDKAILYKIYRLIYMCDLSYKNPYEIINTDHEILSDLIDTRIFVNNIDTDAESYMYNSSKTIYICFRGTSTLKDAFADLNILQKTFIKKGVKVHKGFYKQFKSLEDDLNSNISKLLSDNPLINKLCITGHSLGGGVATIASVYFKNLYKNLEVECFTIGSPRAGNANFVKLYKELIKTSYRIVNHNDPIQYVPMLPRYSHIDNSYCIKKNNIIVIKKPVKGYERIFNTLKNLKYTNIVDPHKTETYMNVFQQKLL